MRSACFLLALAMVCACDGRRGPVVRNATGDYVITAVHTLSVPNGIRGPNLLQDPLMPGESVALPSDGERLLAYDEDGDCYRLTTAVNAQDTLDIGLDLLVCGNIHYGRGAVPVRIINGLNVRIDRVAYAAAPLSGTDLLGVSALWPAETLTVWTEPGTLSIWVEDAGGRAFLPPPSPVDSAPATLLLEADHLFGGHDTVRAGFGPAVLQVVNLVPGEPLADLRLIPANDTSVTARLPEGGGLDTLAAAVFLCPEGSYALEAVLRKGPVLRTRTLRLTSEQGLPFYLRPESLHAAI